MKKLKREDGAALEAGWFFVGREAGSTPKKERGPKP